MLFLNESASFYGTDEVSVEEALAEQLAAAQALGSLEVALLEADYTFHTQVLTEAEKGDESESGAEKKAGFLRRVIEAIKNVCRKIKEAVVKAYNAVKNFFRNLFSKKKDEIEKKAKAKGDIVLVVNKPEALMLVKMADTVHKYSEKVRGIKNTGEGEALKAEMGKIFEGLEADYKKAKEAKTQTQKMGSSEYEGLVNKAQVLDASLKALLSTLEAIQSSLDEEEKKAQNATKGTAEAKAAALSEVTMKVQVNKKRIALVSYLNTEANKIMSGFSGLLHAPVTTAAEGSAATPAGEAK